MQELLEAVGMEDCKFISIPMDPNTKLFAHEDGEQVDASLYRKLVGTSIWLLNSRWIFAFRLAHWLVMNKPLKTHWQAGLCILRYS